MANKIKLTKASNRNTRLHKVTIGTLDLYFSYETCVAFHALGTGLVVHENDWGPTTGRHLNEIDGSCKSDRICGEIFDAELAELLEPLNLEV